LETRAWLPIGHDAASVCVGGMMPDMDPTVNSPQG
jgi:hypothetical protein